VEVKAKVYMPFGSEKKPLSQWLLGLLLGTETKNEHYFVPSNDPTSNWEIRLAPASSE